MLYHVLVLPFLWLSDIPPCGWTTFSSSTQQLVDALLGCFHFLPLMSNAAMNIYVQVFVWTNAFISLGYTPRTGLILGHVACRCFLPLGGNFLHFLDAVL